MVEVVRTAHSRKSGFLSGFERIVAGKFERTPSYAEEARAVETHNFLTKPASTRMSVL